MGDTGVLIKWLIAAILTAGGGAAVVVLADSPATPASNPSKGASTERSGEVELVEAVLKARKDYWTSLDKLRQHYLAVNEIEKARWVEDELRSYHRLMKYSYRLDVKDVPPPTLQPSQRVAIGPTEITRRVSASGLIGVCYQQVSAGRHLAGQVVTVRLHPSVLQVFFAGQLIRTVPRTSTKEVVQLRAHRPHQPKRRPTPN